MNVPYVCLIFVQICRKCKFFRGKHDLSYEQKILDVNYRGRKSEFLLTGKDAQNSFMSKGDYLDDDNEIDEESNPIDSSIPSSSKYDQDLNASQMTDKTNEDDNEEEENEDGDE